jgi:hypothetical protein
MAWVVLLATKSFGSQRDLRKIARGIAGERSVCVNALLISEGFLHAIVEIHSALSSLCWTQLESIHLLAYGIGDDSFQIVSRLRLGKLCVHGNKPSVVLGADVGHTSTTITLNNDSGVWV